ncbi:MAG: hypothetical protein ABEN55_12080 [Bradymonadaceae bacterium]
MIEEILGKFSVDADSPANRIPLDDKLGKQTNVLQVYYILPGTRPRDVEIVSEDGQADGLVVPGDQPWISGPYRTQWDRDGQGNFQYLYGSSLTTVDMLAVSAAADQTFVHRRLDASAAVIRGDDGTGAYREMGVDDAVSAGKVAEQRGPNHWDSQGDRDFAEGGVAWVGNTYLYHTDTLSLSDGATGTSDFALSKRDNLRIFVDGSVGDVTVTLKWYYTAARSTVIESEQLALNHTTAGMLDPTNPPASPFGQLELNDNTADATTHDYDLGVFW